MELNLRPDLAVLMHGLPSQIIFIKMKTYLMLSGSIKHKLNGQAYLVIKYDQNWKDGRVELIEEAKATERGGIVFNIDITELKTREIELANFKTAIDNSPINIMMFNNDNKLILINKSMKAHLKANKTNYSIGTDRDEIRNGILPKLDLEKQGETSVDDLLNKEEEN